MCALNSSILRSELDAGVFHHCFRTTTEHTDWRAWDHYLVFISGHLDMQPPRMAGDHSSRYRHIELP